MSFPVIWLDDRDTYIRASVGSDFEGNLIDISQAARVYFDVLLPNGSWVEWDGTVYTDNNSIQYNMVAADYFKGDYLIYTRVVFIEGVRAFRGVDEYEFTVKDKQDQN